MTIVSIFIFVHFGLNICHFFFFSLFFLNLKGFIIGKLVWLYCSDDLQNSKTNMTKNRDISKTNRDILFFPYRPPHHTCTSSKKERENTDTERIESLEILMMPGRVSDA